MAGPPSLTALHHKQGYLMSDPAAQFPNVNIELKFRVGNLETVRERALSLGAEFRWKRTQQDLFFRARHGRLKLRLEEGAGAELIAYFREDRPEARDSRYVVVPCTHPNALANALGLTVGVLGAVRKTRTLLIWRNVRIHLDEVDDLGTFVEFESVVDGGASRDEAVANLASLVRVLGLVEATPESGSYLDLLMERKGESEEP